MRMFSALAIVAVIGSSGCAQMLGRPDYGPARGRPAEHDYLRTSVVNRWDRVMSLSPDWKIEVVDRNAVTHTGRFVRVSTWSVTLFATDGEREIARDDVIRVNLLGTDPRPTKSRLATAAALGAVLYGASMSVVPTAASGKLWVPPAQVWAGGAAIGVLQTTAQIAHDRRRRTIYVAPIGRQQGR